MRKIKHVSVIAFALWVVGSTLAYSSGQSEQAEPGDQPQSGEQEIRVLWWGSQTRHDLTQQAIELFEEQNAGTTVQPEFLGWSGYWERLATQAAGGEMPDVVQTALASGWGTRYVERELLADLNPMIDDGSIDVSAVSESTLGQNRIGGGLYGIPLGVNAPAIAYDPVLIEEAGLSPPSEDWTFEEFAQLAVAYHEATGEYGIDNFEAMNDFFPYWLRTRGLSFTDNENDRLGYQDDQLLVDFWSFLMDMQEQGGLAPPDVASEHTALENRLISLGRAPMTFIFSNQLRAIESAVGRPVQLSVMPGPNQAAGMFIKSAMDFSISENSANSQEAAAFVNFITNNIEVNRVLAAERGVPISSEVRAALANDLDGIQAKVFDYIDTVSNMSSPADKPHPAFSELASTLTDFEQQVRYGRLSPEEAAAAFREEAEGIFERTER